MILLVGLGNPGSEYANTRHNIGYMAVDRIIHRYSFSPFKSKFKGLVSLGSIEGEKVAILKPETFMNLSGESVLSFCSFYKVLPEDIIVFQDDMDIQVGRVKVKVGGSAGGHNGIKNIDAHVGPNYTRVRIGVGRPTQNREVVDWVLSSFDETDSKNIDAVLDKISENLPFLLRKKNAEFMNLLSHS